MQEVKAYDVWIEELEQKVKKMPKLPSRLTNFDVLPRLGTLLSHMADKCAVCNHYWYKLQESTVTFEEFFDNGNHYLQEFENTVSEIMDHLKSQHQIRPKGMVLSMYVIIAMVVGLLLGALVGFVGHNIKGGVMIGWMIGVVVGWVLGKNAERKLKKQNRIF